MIVHVCGMNIDNSRENIEQSDLINSIFTIQNNENNTYNYTVRTSKEPKWEAFIYREQRNFSQIKNSIKDNIKKAKENKHNKKYKVYKNNMILCFADNDCDKLLLKEFKDSKKELNENFPLILFIFKNTTKSIRDYKNLFFDITYLKCINLGDISSDDNNNDKIKSLKILYLFTILKNRYDNYFNEGGYKVIDEINPLTNMSTIGIYLPILLIGNPGMGKSTFINVIAGERISKATSSVEPVTSKAAYYDIKIPGNPVNINHNNFGINNTLLNTEAYIRFIDTPGFDQNKDVEIAINEVNHIFKSFEEGKERIPVILYFLQSGRSFGNEPDKKESTLKLLKFLKTKKAKILFIITRCHEDEEEEWEQAPSFKEFLGENKLDALVENNDSNILTCNLVGRSAFGMKKIFQKLHSCLNLVDGKEIYNESLIKGIVERKTFDQKLQYIKHKTHLFDEFLTQEDIIKYGDFKSKALIGSLSLIAGGSGAIPIPFCDVPIMISLIGTAIIKIASFYGYAWRKISKNDIISILNGEKYVKKNEENDEYINTEQSGQMFTKVIIFDIIKGLLLGSFMTATALVIDDGIKAIPVIGTLLGCFVGSIIDFSMLLLYGNRAKNYFQSKCRTDDGTIFFCIRCHEYEIIFKKFKEFQNYDIIYPK